MKHPEAVATTAGVLFAAGLLAVSLAFAERSPEPSEPSPEPLPIPSACVQAANPDWCALGKWLDGFLPEQP
ncbi:MAG: hypothetical protein ACREGD_00210 [Candidatus Saccharimonadales bacterium]